MKSKKGSSKKIKISNIETKSSRVSTPNKYLKVSNSNPFVGRIS